jgi:hypothetical protein
VWGAETRTVGGNVFNIASGWTAAAWALLLLTDGQAGGLVVVEEEEGNVKGVRE